MNRDHWVRMASLAVVLCACTGEADPAKASASCDNGDNPLRFLCALGERPADNRAVTWTISLGGEPVRTLVSEAGSDKIVLWGLVPDTEYTWEAEIEGDVLAEGTMHTGLLPEGLASVEVTVTGQPRALDHFMVPYDCGGESGLVMYGPDGLVSWFEPIDFGESFGPPAGLAGYQWTEDDRVIAVVDMDRAVMMTASGEVLFDVSGFERPLHHDVVEMGGYIFVLNAEEHDGYVVDGLYVLDGAGQLVADWDLAEHVAVEGSGIADPFWSFQFPGAIDWSHANGLTADGETHLLVSLNVQNAILRLDADPSSPDFGEIDWILTGSENSALTSDFQWTDGGSFHGQHHAMRRADGGLSVFDNGDPMQDGTSRGLFLEIDESAMTISESTSWSVDRFCMIEGGTYELAGGGALVTCDTAHTVYEFAPGEAEPVWTATIDCPSGGVPFGALQRAQPISFQR